MKQNSKLIFNMRTAVTNPLQINFLNLLKLKNALPINLFTTSKLNELRGYICNDPISMILKGCFLCNAHVRNGNIID
jgi:hypothetical protein